MNAEVRRELEHLLSALCDGALTDEEHVRLDLLLADEACRRYYLEYVDMHARLLVHPGLGAGDALPPVAETAAAVTAARPRWKLAHVLRYAAVAACSLAASLLLQLWWRSSVAVEDHRGQHVAVDPAKLPAPDQPVATLMQTADTAWQDAPEPLPDGTRLKPGTLQLHKGLARIRFDNGSELLVQGPAELRIEASDAATLQRGRLVFRSDVMTAPFDLHTPAATLIDLGSEYGVTVGPDGEEVHVFEGDVQRVPRSLTADAEPEYLQAGEARRCGPVSFPSQPAKFDPTRFVRLLAAPPAPDAAAGLLAYEGFDYHAPDAITMGKANGGLGWISPWTVTVDRPLERGEQKRPPLNVKEGLTRPGAVIPAVGGRFDYAGVGVFYRQLATPLRLDTDGVYFISCLFRRAGPSGHPFHTVALMLRPNEAGPPPAKAKDAHNGKRKDKDHHEHGHEPKPSLANRLMIGTGGSNQVYTRLGPHCGCSSLPISSNVTYLLVAKIVASRASYDQVSVRVYDPTEPIGAEEPASWTLISPAFRSNLVFDWLGVHVNSNNRKMIDEIRVGTTWSSVTGPWRRVAKDKNG